MTKFCTGARGFGGDTQDCCAQHDRDYARDTSLSRYDADVRLMCCVAFNGRPWRAIAMFMAVRAFGWARYKGAIK